MSKITYDDKVDLQVATNIANINKVTASDMNEIKNVVNNNAEEVGDITSLTTTDKTNVVNAVNELNAPEKWVSVGANAPTDGTRVWFAKGKNLLNTKGIVKGRLDDGVIGYESGTTSLTYDNNSFSFTTNVNYRGCVSDYISRIASGYVFNSNALNSAYSLTIACYDENKIWLSNAYVDVESGGTKRTFSISDATKYIRLYFSLSTAGTITINNPILEKGSTATTYEPYIEQSINVDNSTLIGQDNLVSVGINQPGDGKRVWFAKGKNLFDIDNAYHGTINGSGAVAPNEEFRTTQNIPTQPGKTYYFSTTQKSGTTGNQIYIAYYNSSGTFVSRTSYNLLKSAFTTPANCYYMRAGVMSKNQENIMLNEGTIELPYEPYVNPSINVDEEEWYSKPKVLWTNPSPANNFASQVVTLADNLSNYKYYEVIYRHHRTLNIYSSTGKVLSSGFAVLMSSRFINANREVTAIGTGTITFGHSTDFLTYGSTTATNNNDRNIPIQILGYK